MELGKKISSLRKNKSISQELLAENAGTSLRTIQRIENGISVPRPFTLKAIADALDINVAELTSADQQSIKHEKDSTGFPVLRLINSSTLVVLVLPLFNILLPLLFWSKNKEHEIVNHAGKRIISFQVLWTLASVLILLLSHIVHYKLTGSFVSGRIPLIFFVYVMLLATNFFYTLRSAIMLKNENTNVYAFVPSLF